MQPPNFHFSILLSSAAQGPCVEGMPKRPSGAAVSHWSGPCRQDGHVSARMACIAPVSVYGIPATRGAAPQRRRVCAHSQGHGSIHLGEQCQTHLHEHAILLRSILRLRALVYMCLASGLATAAMAVAGLHPEPQHSPWILTVC